MAQKTWFGGIGNIDNPYDWVTPGFIASGDTLTVAYGTVSASAMALSGFDIELAGPVSSAPPVLALENVILTSSLVRILPFRFDQVADPARPIPHDAPSHATMKVSGGVLSDTIIIVGDVPIPVTERPPPEAPTPTAIGTVDGATTSLVPPNGAALTINLQPGGVFINTGLIEIASDSSLDVQAPKGAGVFVNNGDIQTSGIVRVAAPVTGIGDITAFRSALEFTDRVDASETISLDHAHLVLDKPMEFLGSIEHLTAAPSTVVLLGANVTDSVFSDHQLRLFDGSDIIADLHLPNIESMHELSVTNSNGNALLVLGTVSNAAISFPEHATG